jgi:hypothetical protein
MLAFRNDSGGAGTFEFTLRASVELAVRHFAAFMLMRLLIRYNYRNNVDCMIELISAIGNSLGLILPKDALSRLKVGRATHCSLPNHRMATV